MLFLVLKNLRRNLRHPLLLPDGSNNSNRDRNNLRSSSSSSSPSWAEEVFEHSNISDFNMCHVARESGDGEENPDEVEPQQQQQQQQPQQPQQQREELVESDYYENF